MTDTTRILYWHGRRCSVRTLAKSRRRVTVVRVGRVRYRVSRHEAWLPQVGAVVVFISRSQREVRGLVTNAWGLTERGLGGVVRSASVDRDAASGSEAALGVGEVFVRRWQAQERHWTLAGLAYNLVVLWNGSR